MVPAISGQPAFRAGGAVELRMPQDALLHLLLSPNSELFGMTRKHLSQTAQIEQLQMLLWGKKKR